MGKEVWKDVEGYNGKYKVSSYGRIKSTNYNGKGVEGELKPSLLKSSGRYVVYLVKDGVSVGKTLSRLVAETFIPNPDKKYNVLFKDGDTHNNRAENLYWANHKENPKYNLAEKRSIERCSVPIVQLTKDGKFVAEYASSAEASRQSNGYFKQNSITRVCTGHLYSHHGYVWRHKKNYATNK